MRMRIWVVASQRPARLLCATLSDLGCTRGDRGPTAAQTIAGIAQEGGCDVLVLDESGITGPNDADETVAALACRHGIGRVVFHGSGIPASSPYLVRLVSEGGVDDVVLDSIESDPVGALRRALLGQRGPFSTSCWKREPEPQKKRVLFGRRQRRSDAAAK